MNHSFELALFNESIKQRFNSDPCDPTWNKRFGEWLLGEFQVMEIYGSRCESVGSLWYNWTVILPPASSHKCSDGTVIIFKWRYYKQTHSQIYAINKPFLVTFFFYSIWFFDISLVLKKHFPLKYYHSFQREGGWHWVDVVQWGSCTVSADPSGCHCLTSSCGLLTMSFQCSSSLPLAYMNGPMTTIPNDTGIKDKIQWLSKDT